MLHQHQRWLEDYLSHLQTLNRSPHTVLNYQKDLKEFIKWFETAYPGEALNRSNVQVISSYSKFLDEGRYLELPPALPTHISPEIFGSSPGESYQRNNWLISWIPRFLKWWEKRKKFSKNQIKMSLPELGSPKRESTFLQKKMATFRHPLSPSSRRRHLSSIRNFFEFHKQINEDFNRLFPTNPVKPTLHSIKLKDQDIKHTVLLPPGDWERLDESTHWPEDRLILYLLYYAGLRLTEVAQIKKTDFREHGQLLSVIRKGGIRHEFVPEKSKEIFYLLDLLSKRMNPQSSYVFPNRQGGAISPRLLSYKIRRMIKKAGCLTSGLSPHSFRKACATRLYLKSKDLIFVRDYLNHSDAKVTQTYIDPSATKSLLN